MINAPIAAKLHCTSGPLVLSRHRCGTMLATLNSIVWDWRILRVWPTASVNGPIGPIGPIGLGCSPL